MRGWYELCTFEQWVLFEEHSHHTFRRWRRPVRDGLSGLSSTTLETMQVPRNDGPCNCRSNGCLLAPSTVRTPPAGTFPLVSATVSSRMVVSDYFGHFLSSPRGLAMGVDALWLELSWNNSKPTPCP